MDNNQEIDLDNDGEVSKVELNLYAKKLLAQRNLAIGAMISMVVVAVVLLTPLVAESRVEKLSEIITWFFISQAGIVGAFMGISAWMSRK